MRRGSDDVTWAEHRPDDSDRNVTRRHITPTLLLVTVLPGHDVVFRHRFQAMPLVKTRRLTYHPYKTNSGKSRKDLQRVRKALITKKKKENTRRIAQRLILSGTRREWPSLFLHGETTRGKKRNWIGFRRRCRIIWHFLSFVTRIRLGQSRTMNLHIRFGDRGEDVNEPKHLFAPLIEINK